MIDRKKRILAPLSVYLVKRRDLEDIKLQILKDLDEADSVLWPVLAQREKEGFLAPLLNEAGILKKIKGNITKNSLKILTLPMKIKRQCHIASSFDEKPLLGWRQTRQKKQGKVGNQVSLEKVGLIFLPSYREGWLKKINSYPKLFMGEELPNQDLDRLKKPITVSPSYASLSIIYAMNCRLLRRAFKQSLIDFYGEDKRKVVLDRRNGALLLLDLNHEDDHALDDLAPPRIIPGGKPRKAILKEPRLRQIRLNENSLTLKNSRSTMINGYKRNRGGKNYDSN